MKHLQVISSESARPARAESLLTKQQEISAATDIVAVADDVVDLMIKVVTQAKDSSAS